MRNIVIVVGTGALVGCFSEPPAFVHATATVDRVAAFSLRVDGQQATSVSCDFGLVDTEGFAMFAIDQVDGSPSETQALKARTSEEFLGQVFPWLGEMVDVGEKSPSVADDLTLYDSYQADAGLRYYTLVVPEREAPAQVEIEIRTDIAGVNELDPLRDSAPAELEWVFGL